MKKIDIDFITNSVIVEFDPLLMTKGEIKNRLERSGYKFVGRQEDDIHNYIPRRLYPFISCLFDKCHYLVVGCKE